MSRMRGGGFRIGWRRGSFVCPHISLHFIFVGENDTNNYFPTGEKAKDQKESRDRDAENQLHAGYSYTSPDPDDLGLESELSGLPWGGPSMRHIVERGKATQGGSRQGSRDYSLYEYETGRGVSGNSRGSDSR
ncbi:hypothetical protein VC83_02944 [Pseudogymnoascus destructans]|uniref:Uncharacterized protein n=1 Tax=Pseudogymnoascus destructans TaxID=655981 RepID=A0A177AFM2_9PEZI|nr:uncharacterized protein VC83_02944 [Pseudogymnoascus destructans]OAF60212.1 hypothetical protein VC83_02944 [Pseudogymnoascus destructans]